MTGICETRMLSNGGRRKLLSFRVSHTGVDAVIEFFYNASGRLLPCRGLHGRSLIN